MNLVGIRCIINGIKYKVLMDDGRTVLVESVKKYPFHGSLLPIKRWVSRQTVDPGAPPYFWLGAEAEAISALSQQG